MASAEAIARRRAEVINRLGELSGQVAKQFGVEVPDLAITNRDPELAWIQRLEAMGDLMERILNAGSEEEATSPASDSEPVSSEAAVTSTKKAAKKARKSRK